MTMRTRQVTDVSRGPAVVREPAPRTRLTPGPRFLPSERRARGCLDAAEDEKRAVSLFVREPGRRKPSVPAKATAGAGKPEQ